MKLEMIGLNHTVFDTETRSRAAVTPERLNDVVNRFLELDNVEGMVVISTCNRVEL
jgi:glutamyl-tRNA reductase